MKESEDGSFFIIASYEVLYITMLSTYSNIRRNSTTSKFNGKLFLKFLNFPLNFNDVVEFRNSIRKRFLVEFRAIMYYKSSSSSVPSEITGFLCII